MMDLGCDAFEVSFDRSAECPLKVISEVLVKVSYEVSIEAFDQAFNEAVGLGLNCRWGCIANR